MPSIFFLLSGTIDILGRSCMNNQDLILVEATHAQSLQESDSANLTAAAAAADTFVPFPDARPCPPSPRAPSVPHQQKVLFCLGLPRSCWHNKAVLFLAERSASELSCGWSPFFLLQE